MDKEEGSHKIDEKVRLKSQKHHIKWESGELKTNTSSGGKEEVAQEKGKEDCRKFLVVLVGGGVLVRESEKLTGYGGGGEAEKRGEEVTQIKNHQYTSAEEEREWLEDHVIGEHSTEG